jgi:hypothetical protein
MDLLRQAKQAGFSKIPQTPSGLKSDSDLQSLNSRADFQAFVRDLEKSTTPKAP